MSWLIVGFIAALAYMIWKGIRRNPPPVHKPLPAASPEPEHVTLTVNVEMVQAEAVSGDRVNDTAQGATQQMGQEKDAWEDWSDELYAEASRELAVDLGITYCDRDGKTTHRDITVEKYARTQDGGILAAYCHLRKSRRPFRFSRIKKAIDRKTGAPIHDLGAWLDRQYETSPKGLRDKFVSAHEAALGALFFVAKADGAFRAKEKAVMQAFCASQGLKSPDIQALVVETVAGWAVPSRIAYGKDLRELLQRDEGYRQGILDHAKSMLASTKTAHDEATRALERMERELMLAGRPNNLKSG